jgi:hypothetical protein
MTAPPTKTNQRTILLPWLVKRRIRARIADLPTTSRKIFRMYSPPLPLRIRLKKAIDPESNPFLPSTDVYLKRRLWG